MQRQLLYLVKFSIRWIEDRMNNYLNKILKTKDEDYVIAVDTDSIYLHLGPLVEVIYKEREKTTEGVVGFLNKICEMEFEKYISSSYEAFGQLRQRLRAEDVHET